MKRRTRNQIIRQEEGREGEGETIIISLTVRVTVREPGSCRHIFPGGHSVRRNIRGPFFYLDTEARKADNSKRG
jgi:hypothetical protein